MQICADDSANALLSLIIGLFHQYDPGNCVYVDNLKAMINVNKLFS